MSRSSCSWTCSLLHGDGTCRVLDGSHRNSLSGNLATMGCDVPYAIAAKFAFPDRVVVAMVGDGAMQMAGNMELVT